MSKDGVLAGLSLCWALPRAKVGQHTEMAGAFIGFFPWNQALVDAWVF